MVSQTLIEELKQQKIWIIYFKTITKNGNTTKSPRSAERMDGHRVQKIKIIWNCIGEFHTPTSHQ